MTPGRRLTVAARDHRGGALPLVRALADAGHELVNPPAPADVLLIDLDAPLPSHRHLIELYRALGAAILIYPHGGGSMVTVYDGLYEPDPAVTANLVHAAGIAESLRRVQYPAPVRTIGWTLCQERPFRPAQDVRRVLFAPMHPCAGVLSDVYRERNADVFRQLLGGPWQLTVRHMDSIEQNGLWPVDGVRFAAAHERPPEADIDAADVVVAAQGTFPHLSVARGAPTVLYTQLNPAMYGLPGEAPGRLLRADRYRDYLRHPFDVEDGPIAEILHAAARDSAAVATWRRRFIGAPFDPTAFARLVEGLIAAPEGDVVLDDLRSHVTVAFADELAERPELLAAYAADHGPEDDATLVVWGPGEPGEQLLATVQDALGRAGVAAAATPDVLLLTHGSLAAVESRLAAVADAVLSDWPQAGALASLPRTRPLPLAA